MTKKFENYKCSICGNIISVDHEAAGILSCCNRPMTLIKENNIEASTEKHIPTLNKINETKYLVIVGSVEHPMTKEHYIEWIEVLTDKDEKLTFYLKPDMEPKAEFTTANKIVEIKAYCNLHGLWNIKF